MTVFIELAFILHRSEMSATIIFNIFAIFFKPRFVFQFDAVFRLRLQRSKLLDVSLLTL
jgi:hypothetical protein